MGRGWVRARAVCWLVAVSQWTGRYMWVFVSDNGWVRGASVDSWVDGSMNGYTLCCTGCVVSSCVDDGHTNSFYDGWLLILRRQHKHLIEHRLVR